MVFWRTRVWAIVRAELIRLLWALKFGGSPVPPPLHSALLIRRSLQISVRQTFGLSVLDFSQCPTFRVA